MAGAAAAATTPSPFPPPPPISGNPRPSLPSSFPSRGRRTNRLRKKILKTLENKPYPDPQFPRKTDTISIEETVQAAESNHFSLSEGPGFVDGILGNFSTKSFTKIGVYLVGVFLVHSIFSVMISGSKDLDDKDENFNEKKSNLLSSGNRSSMETKEGGIGSVDGSEIDNRIMKIQEMARQAREQEKMEGKRKCLVEEEEEEDGDIDNDNDSVDQIVKKKEIDNRLMKLRQSLEGEYQKPAPKIPRKEGDVGDDVDNASLMFKKKFKYKSPSIDSGDKPKGFGGTQDVYVANGSAIKGVNVDDGRLQADEKSDGGTLSKDEVKVQEPRETKTESIAGTSKEPKYDNQTSKAEKSGKSSNVESKKPRGFGKESSDTVITTKHDDFNKNGSLKGKKGWTKKSARTQTNFWWTSLPYVMAVAMQSGGDGEEESSGLFIIRNTSGLHHTVTFEDRSDATNFCYLLESFFEDLNNFSTNIIPIPTNELEVEVKSQKMKVVVVKKGQLKLYAGQPLEDVESALRALIEQQSE